MIFGLSHTAHIRTYFIRLHSPIVKREIESESVIAMRESKCDRKRMNESETETEG